MVHGFARACRDAGLIFIGPSPESMEAMGSKTEARQRMQAAGVPVVPGLTKAVTSVDEIVDFASSLHTSDSCCGSRSR